MDVSPIQHSAAIASAAVRPAPAPAPATSAVAPAQAAQPAAEESKQVPIKTASMRVLVSWHPGSIGYVTQVVDQHSGSVVFQTPPDQVLAVVLKVMERLKGGAA